METGFAVACGVTFLRACVVAVAATALGAWLASALRGCRSGWSRGLWATIVFPLLWPPIIPGYAFGNACGWLVHHPFWAEVLYTALLIAQTMPVAAVIAFHLPPAALDPAGRHVVRLLRRRATVSGIGDGGGDRLRPVLSRLVRWRLWLIGEPGQLVAIAAVIFVLAFQEFEMASLMRRPSWTVWILDAQAGGMYLSSTLSYAAWPVLAQSPAVLVVALLLRRMIRWRGPVRWGEGLPSGVGVRIVGGAARLVSVLLLGLVPLRLLARDLFVGGGVFWRQGDVLASALQGGAMSAGLAVCAWTLAGRAVESGSAVVRAAVFAPTVVGLSGALATGLLVLAVFQLPWLSSWRGTVIPYAIAEVCLSLPRAVLLRGLVESESRRMQTHAAELLARGGVAVRRSAAYVLWRVDRRFRFACVALLAWWTFFELTAAGVLNPILLEPIPLVLYNQMHYGHIAGLTAMVLLVTASAGLAVAGAFAVYATAFRVGWWIRHVFDSGWGTGRSTDVPGA